jgi:hypothetical protein
MGFVDRRVADRDVAGVNGAANQTCRRTRHRYARRARTSRHHQDAVAEPLAHFRDRI